MLYISDVVMMVCLAGLLCGTENLLLLLLKVDVFVVFFEELVIVTNIVINVIIVFNFPLANRFFD